MTLECKYRSQCFAFYDGDRDCAELGGQFCGMAKYYSNLEKEVQINQEAKPKRGRKWDIPFFIGSITKDVIERLNL
jgi:hypothetical protein